MDASLYRDNRSLNSITFGDLVDRYTEGIWAIRPFGNNKAAVIKTLTAARGSVPLSALNADRLGKCVDQRRAGGAGGITVGIDLTYIGGILKTASAIWKTPVDQIAVSDARGWYVHQVQRTHPVRDACRD